MEAKYVRPGGLRVEWRLCELDNGQLHRCPPKDESRRTIAAPDWLVELVSDHIRRTGPGECSCHGFRYVFTGHRASNGSARTKGPRLADVAQRAGVAVGTVWAVLNNREVVAEATRARVLAAVEELVSWRRNSVISSSPDAADQRG